MAVTTNISLTLSLYISRRFLAGFFLVLVSIGAIIFLIDVVELFRRAASRPEVTFRLVISLATLKVPHEVQRIMPFCVLFGGMYAFWRLTRSSELVVARAAGISVWQFLLPAVVVAMLIGAVSVAVINPLASSMLLRYERLDASLFKGRSQLLSISETGLWLRQADKEGQSVIHALRMVPGSMALQDVTVYLFDAKHKFTGRVDAATARLEEGAWRLSGAVVTGPNQPSRRMPQYRLPTHWTAAKIEDSFSSPETLSFWNLPGFIRLLDQAGFTATRHRVYWYSLLAVPVLLAAMVLIAASFSLRMARRGGLSFLVFGGVIFSFFLFFLSDLVFALGLSATIPALLAAWTPTLVTMLIGLTILLHIEDG
jgi:lipopolysaccharide export system permease protein